MISPGVLRPVLRTNYRGERHFLLYICPTQVPAAKEGWERLIGRRRMKKGFFSRRRSCVCGAINFTAGIKSRGQRVVWSLQCVHSVWRGGHYVCAVSVNWLWSPTPLMPKWALVFTLFHYTLESQRISETAN